MPGKNLTEVAVYRRRVGASLERVWENVFDWEHLPWLHASSFTSIELRESRSDGWAATVGLATPERDRWSEIDLRTERDRNRYLTATVGGTGVGSEIWTELKPVGDRETEVEVRFLVPGIEPGDVEPVGTLYRELYARLWDEDERMMRHRQAMLERVVSRRRTGDLVGIGDSAPADVDLGTREELSRRMPCAVEVRGWHYLVCEVQGELLVRTAVCPHLLGPLEEGEFAGATVRCPWHGYQFDLRTGRSCDGRSLRLEEGPVAIEREGRVYLRFRTP